MSDDDFVLEDGGLKDGQEKDPSEYETVTLSSKKPVEHGARSTFVINRDVHSTLREQFPAESYDDEVVCSDYTPDFVSDDERYVVELSTSDWKAGSEDSSAPYQSYHLKIRELLPDGTTAESAPLIPLAIAVVPQYEDAVYRPKDEDTERAEQGEYPSLYGTGAKVGVQTGNVQSPSKVEHRALDLLNTVLDRKPALEQGEIADESRRLLRMEVTHRIDKRVVGDVVKSLRKSKDLLPGAATHDNNSGGYLKEKFCSDRFGMLGFDAACPIQLKVYYPAAGSSAPGQMHHPRVEAALGPNEPHPHVSEFEDIVESLQEVLLSHIEWAGIDDEDIIEGELYPEDVQNTAYQHPTNRRWLLRDHYMRDKVLYEIIHECKKSTDTIYDILQAIINCHHQGATAKYRDLVERTGIPKRTVRYHVARLEEKGILNRVQTTVALIEFVSRDLREWTEEKLRSLADELGKDRQERIKDRKTPDEDKTADEGGSEDSTNEASGPVSGSTDSAAPDEQIVKNSVNHGWVKHSASGRTIPPPR